MSNETNGYQRLKGSERRHSSSAEFLGIADPEETFTVTIVLRRRTDGAPMPGHDFFLNTPPRHRQRMPASEFASLYGASDEDIAKITHFATTHHLSVLQTHAARRTIVVSGVVSSMETCFGVKLGHFKHQIALHPNEPETETYRGYHGFIHVPNDLAGIIVGVFGLDNRTIALRDSVDDADDADDDDFEHLTVPQVTKLYSFPARAAFGQTIAILSHAGYKTADIKKYFDNLKLCTPAMTDVEVGKKNESDLSEKKRRETTMDICISGSAAVGAAVAIYFSAGDEKSWVDVIKRVTFPEDGDPNCSILSSSYHLYPGDDDKDDDSGMHEVNSSYHDAAIQGITVCNSSGDYGSYSNIDDTQAHVHFPASDPWVLTVGGTAISNVDDSENSYTETVWNHSSRATGGGISAYFSLPHYQTSANVPVSVNTSGQSGCGVPDVAANADPRSGYEYFVSDADGNYNVHVAGGTSAAAPLWAGLIARINASLGVDVGFINPIIYSLGSDAFNDIDGSVGPSDNHIDGYAAGYPAKRGWDACTGWGSINGTALLCGLEQAFDKKCWIQPFVIRIDGENVLSVSFAVRVSGFRPEDFGVENVPPLRSATNPVLTITSGFESGITVECMPDKLVVQDDTLPPTPQIFTWVYTMQASTFNSLQSQFPFVRLFATVTTLEGYSVCGSVTVILG